MIYGAYIIGKDGLNWASLPFWREEKKSDLSGPLISSLVSLSDVTFKGKVRRITTKNRTFLLKHANSKPGFIAAVIADKNSENKLALTFLHDIFSQTKLLTRQRRYQVGSGYVLPQFRAALEKKIEQSYKHLMVPSPSTVQNIGKDIYCILSFLRSEEKSYPFASIKAKALKKKKASYQEFLAEYKQKNVSSTQKDVLTQLSKGNFEKLLIHARNLKENTSTPLNSLIWILTSVYLNRFPPSYPAPPISTILKEIHIIQKEISQELKPFLKLAKLELLGKKSLKHVEKHRKFLEKNDSALIDSLLHQAPPLKPLLSLLLIKWYPKVLDSRILNRITEEINIDSPIWVIYVKTLKDVHERFNSKRSQGGDLSLLESLGKTILKLLKNTSEREQRSDNVKIAQYAMLFTTNFYVIPWHKLNYRKLKHYLNLVLKVGKCLLSNHIFRPPFVLPLIGILPLMIQEAVLLRSTLQEFINRDFATSLRKLHKRLVNQVLTCYYTNRMDPYHTHWLLSTSFENLGKSFPLLDDNEVIRDQLSYLRFLQTTSPSFDIARNASFMQGILSSLAIGATFLAPAIPLSNIKTRFIKKYFPIPLQIAMYSDTNRHNILLQYSLLKVLKHANPKEDCTRLRVENCEFLFREVAERSTYSLFFQGLLLKALSEAVKE